MITDFRVSQFASLFSDGVETETPSSPAERRRRRAELLRESPGRKFARVCADLNHCLSPRAIAGLPSTLDFFIREKSIGVAGLPDARHVRRVPDGLAGLASDLSPAAIVDAYSRGLFLRWILGQPSFWAPEFRMTATPCQVVEPESALKSMRRGGYRITLDRDFDAVVNAASAEAVRERRPYSPPAQGMNLFAALHDAGYAHSVEIRDRAGVLCGGLFGIACGRVFTIQARFGAGADVADIALLALARHLGAWGFELIDGCTDASLETSGFEIVAREAHLASLPGGMGGGQPGRWLVQPELLA